MIKDYRNGEGPATNVYNANGRTIKDVREVDTETGRVLVLIRCDSGNLVKNKTRTTLVEYEFYAPAPIKLMSISSE